MKSDNNWNVYTDPSQARAQERMLPEDWDRRFSEMERRYLDPRTLNAYIEPAPATSQAAFEEVFHEEIRAGTVIFGLDPFLKRLTIWQKRLNLYEGGEVYERAIIFSDSFDPGACELPGDLLWLNHDGRYDRYEGCLGAYWVPSSADMHYLKELCDHWVNSGKELTMVRGWGKKFVEKSIAAKKEAQRVQADMLRAINDYQYSAHFKVANQMLGGFQGFNFVPGQSLEDFERERLANGESAYVIEEWPAANGEGTIKVRMPRDPEKRAALLRHFERRRLAEEVIGGDKDNAYAVADQILNKDEAAQKVAAMRAAEREEARKARLEARGEWISSADKPEPTENEKERMTRLRQRLEVMKR